MKDRMNIDDLQTDFEQALKDAQKHDEAAARSRQERQQLVDAIVAAVCQQISGAKEYLSTFIPESYKKLLEECREDESLPDNIQMISVEENTDDLNKGTIEECSKCQVSSQDFKNLTANVDELKKHSEDFKKLTAAASKLKELSEKIDNTTNRIEAQQKREDSRVKIPDVVFYCLVATFFSLLSCYIISICANIYVIHNDDLSFCLYGIGAVAVLTNAAIIAIHHRWNNRQQH